MVSTQPSVMPPEPHLTSRTWASSSYRIPRRAKSRPASFLLWSPGGRAESRRQKGGPPWRPLASFHGMEEVVSSNLTRSTIFRLSGIGPRRPGLRLNQLPALGKFVERLLIREPVVQSGWIKVGPIGPH